MIKNIIRQPFNYGGCVSFGVIPSEFLIVKIYSDFIYHFGIPSDPEPHKQSLIFRRIYAHFFQHRILLP